MFNISFEDTDKCKIYKAKTEIDHSDLVKHVVTCVESSGIPTTKVDIPGLTSPRVQTLLNSIAKGVDSYLEIGSYLGATLSSVLKDNMLLAVAIDKWEEQIQPANGSTTPPNSLDEFIKNVEPYKGNNRIEVINNDMFAIDTTNMTNAFSMFFYDGPHDQESTKNIVKHYWNTFKNETVLIFDDANWDGVVNGAREGINECGGYVTYEKLMLNDVEDISQWWNGLYILVVAK